MSTTKEYLKEMDKLLRDLLDELDRIIGEFPELEDTDVRERMSKGIFFGFLKPGSGYELPADFGMFSEEGNRQVRQALEKYVGEARQHAVELGLDTFQARLAAFQDNEVESAEGNFFDDYFGWADPDDYDVNGNVLSGR